MDTHKGQGREDRGAKRGGCGSFLAPFLISSRKESRLRSEYLVQDSSHRTTKGRAVGPAATNHAGKPRLGLGLELLSQPLDCNQLVGLESELPLRAAVN